MSARHDEYSTAILEDERAKDETVEVFVNLRKIFGPERVGPLPSVFMRVRARLIAGRASFVLLDEIRRTLLTGDYGAGDFSVEGMSDRNFYVTYDSASVYEVEEPRFSISLKPCPFCSADPITLKYDSDPSNMSRTIRCFPKPGKTCFAQPSVVGPTEEEAARRWNANR